jgi:hypothetical protein
MLGYFELSVSYIFSAWIPEQVLLDHVDVVHRCRSRSSWRRIAVRRRWGTIGLSSSTRFASPIVLHLCVKLLSSLLWTTANHGSAFFIRPATSSTSPAVLSTLARTPALLAWCAATSDRRARPSTTWDIAVYPFRGIAAAWTLTPISPSPCVFATVLSAIGSALDSVEKTAGWALHAIEQASFRCCGRSGGEDAEFDRLAICVTAVEVRHSEGSGR